MSKFYTIKMSKFFGGGKRSIFLRG
ncbi:stage V sporulation protein M [Sphingobacterium sp. JUb56]